MTEATWLRDGGWDFGGWGPSRRNGRSRADTEREVAAMVRDIVETSERTHEAAAHEAGHAVVAAALGLPVAEISIDERGHGKTRVTWDEAPVDRAVQWSATVLLAGGLAERMFCESSECGGNTSDAQALRELMSRDRPPAIRQAIAHAKAILAEHRDVHERLVDALVRHRRLSGDEVDAILGRAAIQPGQGYPAGMAQDSVDAFVDRWQAKVRRLVDAGDALTVENMTAQTDDLLGLAITARSAQGTVGSATRPRGGIRYCYGYPSPDHTRADFIRNCAERVRAGMHLDGQALFGGPGAWRDCTDEVLAAAGVIGRRRP